MTRDSLIASIDALLALDERKALVPHGVGGLARELFEETKNHLGDPVSQLGGSPEDLRNVLCGVIEIFGIEGAQKITSYALKYRGTNAFNGRKVEQVPVPPMPATVDRRPYDEEAYPGYVEGNADWAANNPNAVTWLADNHAAIRAALTGASA
jgi:hypothetical protein